jgi:hypothetical protein
MGASACPEETNPQAKASGFFVRPKKSKAAGVRTSSGFFRSNLLSRSHMNILPEFDIGKFMSTHDLPAYGQLLAYGIGMAGIGFGLRQIVSAIDTIVKWFRK